MNETDVKEWLTLASHDIETAELLIKQKGHADIIIYHIHQAIENY
jgi:HEPN domain-containing protein